MGLFPLLAKSQLNNLTGSPYSLFGIGVSTNSNIGKNSALGKLGYALGSDFLINNANPASYGGLGEHAFLFDFGFLAELSSISDRSNDEARLASNFSNFAIASSITPRSSFGLSLVPYTNVGYSLLGIESNIEGSLDRFTSNLFGSGALNDFRFSYGNLVTEQLRLGVNFSYLFGLITESEIVNVRSGLMTTSTLNVQEQSNYNGFRMGLGLQYDIHPKLSLGWTVNLPTVLSGKQDRTVGKTLDGSRAPVENETDLDISSFSLPMEVGTGILLKANKKLNLNLDYSIRLWNATDQEDNVGEFTDQYVFGFGAEYIADDTSYKYWQRINLRAGFNYDTGYLKVSDNNIGSYGITAGIGFPLGLNSKSMVNIGFAQTNRGSTEGILVEERVNTVNINVSLKDFWFFKRKIN
ncbi:MAG: membrane protein [Maribacter sp.]